MLAVVHAVYWAELPIPHVEGMVQIWSTQRHDDRPSDLIPTQRLRGWTERPFRNLSSLAAVGPVQLVVRHDSTLERVPGAVVTPTYFETLDIAARAGRMLQPADDAPASSPVAVVSERYARARYGGAARAIGQTLWMGDRSATVAGVVPDGIDPGTDVWVPSAHLVMPPAWHVIGRLAPGASIDGLRRELGARVRAELADDSLRFGGLGATAVPYQTMRRRQGGGATGFLLGTAAVVFVITLSNVASLFVARTIEEARDRVVRVALGAGHSDLMRSAAMRAALVVGCGALVGLLIARWAIDAARVYLRLEVATTIQLDAGLLAGIALLCTIATITLTVPGWRSVARANLRSMLDAGGHAIVGDRGERRARAALLAVQVAAVTVLAVTFGVLARAERNAASVAVAPGAAATALAVIEPPGSPRDSTLVGARLLGEEIERRLNGVPGAGPTAVWMDINAKWGVPPREWWAFDGAVEELRPLAHLYHAVYVSPAYFALRGMRLIDGRPFTRSDDARAARIAIVNRRAAESWWPGSDPIGRRVKLGPAWSPDPWLTVVGIVDERSRLDAREREWASSMFVPGRLPTLYLPWAQLPANVPVGWTTQCLGCDGLLVATQAHDAAPPTSLLNAALYDVAPRATAEITTLADYEAGTSLYADTYRRRTLLGGTGLLALLLAVLGVHSITTESVRARKREIAVRMALGASDRQILSAQVATGATVAIAGVLGGIACVLAFRAVLSRAFFAGGGPQALVGTSAADPRVLACVVVIVVTVVLAAAARAARSATRIDPSQALRA